MTERTAIGVDWASGAWLAVVFSGSDLSETRVFDEIETLWDTYQEMVDRIVVDVPIGLCESRDAATYCCEETDGELSRQCDDLARTVISPRSSSVFTPPAREAARMAAGDDDSYSVVNTLNKELTGKGLMQQAANISDSIVEVEDLLLEGGGEPDVLVEGHPEVCFRASRVNRSITRRSLQLVSKNGWARSRTWPNTTAENGGRPPPTCATKMLPSS